MDLIVAAGRDRVVLLSGFVAGISVFFAPLLVHAIGLLAAYLVDVITDGSIPIFGLRGTLTAQDFRAVFAPAVNELPLLVSAGVLGAVLGQFRRWLARRADPAFLAAGVRPFFPELALVFGLLVVVVLALAATHGGWPQVTRLVMAAPVLLPFMLCIAWLIHAVWSYSFRSVIDLVASEADRTAAAALRQRARLLHSSH